MTTDSECMKKQTEKWLLANVPKHKRNPKKFTAQITPDGKLKFVFTP